MNKIVVRGARSHNLKNVNVEIPKDKLVVITGLSGSGKSSLAFDTIYAEGQRKYVESLSAYARQFLGVMEKADVDSIEGLSPAISIDQKSAGHNPRSTVGTVTEIYDYLRLLYARAGHPHSPVTGRRLQAQTVQQIVDGILNLPEKQSRAEVKILVLSPIIKKRKGTYEELFQRLLSRGFVRVRVDGQVYSLEEEIKLDRYKIHNIEIVVDRIVIKKESRAEADFVKRLTDSVETALNSGDREVLINLVDDSKPNSSGVDLFFSEKLVDPETGESFPQIEPHTFSFNSPFGACQRCNGLGNIFEIEPSRLYNPNLSVSEGGIFPWSRMADNMNSWNMKLVEAVAKAEGFNIREPIGSLKPEHLEILLHGTGDTKYPVTYYSQQRTSQAMAHARFEGIVPNLTRRYKETESDYIRREIEAYMQEMQVPTTIQPKLLAKLLIRPIQ